MGVGVVKYFPIEGLSMKSTAQKGEILVGGRKFFGCTMKTDGEVEILGM
jgi:hypothetical protein